MASFSLHHNYTLDKQHHCQLIHYFSNHAVFLVVASWDLRLSKFNCSLSVSLFFPRLSALVILFVRFSHIVWSIEEDVLHHKIFSDWRYLECKFGLDLAFVQFQYVKQAIPAYLHLKVHVLLKNCYKMDIWSASMCKLQVFYDNVILIDTICPPK